MSIDGCVLLLSVSLSKAASEQQAFLAKKLSAITSSLVSIRRKSLTVKDVSVCTHLAMAQNGTIEIINLTIPVASYLSL